MGFVRDNLLPNERIIYMARIHPAILLPMVPVFIISGLFFAAGSYGSSPLGLGSLYIYAAVIVAFAGLAAALRVILFVLSTEFGLTDRRIIAKSGMIQRRSLELILAKVESVHIGQGLMGRIFDFGTVTITGTGGTRERFPGISNPLVLRRLIHKQLEELGSLPRST